MGNGTGDEMPNDDPLTEDAYELCGEKSYEAPLDPLAEQTLCTLILQRHEYLEYHVPPVRKNLQPSPYPKFTEYQVNMRRKAEILSYKGQGDTNGLLTKSQKWANLAKNPKQLGAKNTQSCPTQSLLFSLSSSCGVPGPIITLYKDPTVPLYNYGYHPSNFNLENDVPLPEWKVFPKYDNEFQNNTLNYIANLVIQNPENNRYTFQFMTSISVNIAGTINTSGTAVDSIQLSIINPKFAVYFTDMLVPNIMSIVFLNVQPITVSFTSSSKGNFSATIYSGMVNVSNFALSTQPQFVYDLKMSFGVNYVLYDVNKNIINPSSSNLTISKANTILNLTGVSDKNYLSLKNCSLKSGSSVPFVPFTLTGKKT